MVDSPQQRRRKIQVEASDPRQVDYGLLKSMIRDEVSLQVKRQVKALIQPLYQVIMTDPVHATQMHTLPQWAVDLLDDTREETDDEDIMDSNNNDYWGL